MTLEALSIIHRRIIAEMGRVVVLLLEGMYLLGFGGAVRELLLRGILGIALVAVQLLRVLLGPHLIPAAREYPLGRLPLGIGVHVLLYLLLVWLRLLLHRAEVLFSGVCEHVGGQGEPVHSEIAVHIAFGSLNLMLRPHDEAKPSSVTLFVFRVVDDYLCQVS